MSELPEPALLCPGKFSLILNSNSWSIPVMNGLLPEQESRSDASRSKVNILQPHPPNPVVVPFKLPLFILNKSTLSFLVPLLRIFLSPQQHVLCRTFWVLLMQPHLIFQRRAQVLFLVCRLLKNTFAPVPRGRFL